MGRKQKIHAPLAGNLESVLKAIAQEQKPKKVKKPKKTRKYVRKDEKQQ